MVNHQVPGVAVMGSNDCMGIVIICFGFPLKKIGFWKVRFINHRGSSDLLIMEVYPFLILQNSLGPAGDY